MARDCDRIQAPINDSDPIDRDIEVFDPNGNLVDGSYSMANTYEIVEFDAPISGTYTVEISRTFLRDSSSNFSAGLNISW